MPLTKYCIYVKFCYTMRKTAEVPCHPQNTKNHNRSDWKWRPSSLLSLAVEVWCTVSLFLEVKQSIKIYLTILQHLPETVLEKWWELWQEHGWVLHHTALVHKETSPELSHKNTTQSFHRYPKSPAFSPVNLLLFPKWIVSLEGLKFQSAK